VTFDLSASDRKTKLMPVLFSGVQIKSSCSQPIDDKVLKGVPNIRPVKSPSSSFGVLVNSN
jgi:hypothetical protein